ncbi:hypothetical protein M3Y97_00560000 [Aphelenchoides bicaudatus]|nr:hypothetical protein M3Y97_00560000 [Aphelenchoides bicaudatus]
MSYTDELIVEAFSFTILAVSLISSILVCIIMFFTARYLKARAINEIKYLNSLIMIAEKRLSMQVFPEAILAEVAKKIGDNVDMMQVMKEERAGFETSKKNATKKDDFKMPDNAYEDVSFSDPQYQTTYGHPMSNDDIFLHKKPIVSASDKDKQ